MQAREEGRVRFLGLTGHHDPAILLEAMRRFDFDTVLVALNVADVHACRLRTPCWSRPRSEAWASSA